MDARSVKRWRQFVEPMMLMSRRCDPASFQRQGRVLCALAVLAFLAGCATRDDITLPSLQLASGSHADAQSGLTGVPDPKDRLQFPGFSVLPPQGEQWVEAPHLGGAGQWQTRIMFWKVVPQPHPESGPHTVFATVRTMEIPPQLRQQLNTAGGRQDFLRFAMNMTVETDKVDATGRRRLVLQKADLDQTIGYDCFKYDVIEEDRGIPGFEGKAFTMDVHAYTCLDPALQLIVQTAYSQRVPPGEAPIDLGREGEEFLKSLAFAVSLGV
jgi:hypothetical protein